MGFLAAISPVLLIPAYEPFVAFVIQAATVAVGVQLTRWRNAKKQSEEGFYSQISLRTVLLAIVPVTVLVAVGGQLPRLDFPAWRSVIVIGLTAGLVSLVGLWICRGTPLQWWQRCLLGGLLAIGLSLCLVWGDLFLYSTYYEDWPLPEYAVKNYPAMPAWIPIILSTLLAYCLIIWMATISAEGIRQSRVSSINRLQLLTYLSLAAVVILVFAPSAIAFWLLLTPLPVPVQDLPKPNGFDDIVEAAKILPNNLIVDSGWFFQDKATDKQLQDAVNEVKPALDRVAIGLKKTVRESVDLGNMRAYHGIFWKRSLARGYGAQAELFERNQDYTNAIDNYLDELQYGLCLARKSLLNDAELGLRFASAACFDIYRILNRELIVDHLQVIRRLEQVDSLFEPIEISLERDRAWAQHIQGWHAHLFQIMNSFAYGHSWQEQQYTEWHGETWTSIRLLQLEVALHLWKSKHSEWPTSLDQLVPGYIEAIPSDPLAPGNSPLKYIRQGDRFIAYGVGLNRLDEGGQVPEHDGNFNYDLHTGDLRLDILFAPDETELGHTATERGTPNWTTNE